MAVSTQKFLPSSKSGALVIRTSKISIPEKGRGSLTKEILQMKSKVLKLQGEVIKNKKSNDKEQDVKRKKEEKEKTTKREKQLEKKDGFKGINLPNVISNLPGGSIVDTIKKFVGFTFLGWLLEKYEFLMPKLEKFMSIAKPAVEGIVNATGAILNGVYNFVDTGYKAYDKVSATIKNIGGRDAEKKFNELSGHLNKLLNGTLLLSMLVASTAPGKSGKPGSRPSAAGGYAKPNANLQNYLNRNTQTKSIERTYGNDAARMYEARRAQGGSHARALADVRRRFQPIGSQGSLGGGTSGSGVFSRGLAKTPQRAATKVFGKAAGKAVSKIGGRVPIVGPLIDFGIRTLIYKEPLGKAAAAAVGLGVGQALGGWLGGAIGGIVGSVVPFLGTVLVGAAGATVGSLIGGVIGDMLGAALYDFVSGFSDNKKPSKKATGGQINPKNAQRKRVKTSIISRQKIQPQQTKPGQDVGGRNRIEQFYGEKGELIVKSLEKTSKDVKKLPLDWASSIGGAFIDMTMGQKPDKKLAVDIGKSFGMFVDTVINNEVTATTGQITKALVGMANGGSVPANLLERGQVGRIVAKNIEERMQTIFDQSSTIVLKNIRSLQMDVEELRQMQEESRRRQGGGGGGAGGGGGVLPGEAPPEIKAMLEAIAGAEGGWDSVNPNTSVTGLSKMTIAQARVAAMRKGINQLGGSGAMGKFQQMPDYILSRARDAGLDPYKDKFTEENQVKIARMLMASVYPGGEAQLIKDIRKNPLKVSEQLRGTWPSLPGGSQENVHTGGFLNRFNESLLIYESLKNVPVGKSKFSSDIEAFRAFRNKQFGAPSQRKPTGGAEYYQVRELGIYGSKGYRISPLADDFGYEIDEHEGAGHKENRAFDIPVPYSSAEGDKVAAYWRGRGYNVIWKSDGHFDHVHVEVPPNQAKEFFKIVSESKKRSGKPVKSSKKPAAQKERPWWDKFGFFGGAAAEEKRKKDAEFLKKNPGVKLYNQPQGYTPYTSRFSRKEKGGSVLSPNQQSSYSSLNKLGTLKEDTSLNNEMVVMYQKEIIMMASS